MKSSLATVFYADFSSFSRIIAISDVHGDSDGFDALLQKLNFSNQDALVITGDILERGPNSLKLLQIVIRLSKNGNIFTVIGNNDTPFLNWLRVEVEDEAVCAWMHQRSHSMFLDVAEALALPYETADQVSFLRQTAVRVFSEEFAFLDRLPHIIDSPVATFVHAGLQPGPLEMQDVSFCIMSKAFGEQTHRFSKPVVVGHWPASNYSGSIIDVNVHYLSDTNVYCIDGGNSMKEWAQINYLIFHKDGTTETGYHDALAEIRLLDPQEETPSPVTLLFPHTMLTVLDEKDGISTCYIPYLDQQLPIPSEQVYEYFGSHYCWDFTTYYPPVQSGDIVSLCRAEGHELVIKRNGIVGKYRGRYEIIKKEGYHV